MLVLIGWNRDENMITSSEESHGSRSEGRGRPRLGEVTPPLNTPGPCWVTSIEGWTTRCLRGHTRQILLKKTNCGQGKVQDESLQEKERLAFRNQEEQLGVTRQQFGPLVRVFSSLTLANVFLDWTQKEPRWHHVQESFCHEDHTSPNVDDDQSDSQPPTPRTGIPMVH